MEANELRIGNLILWDDEAVKVCRVDFDSISDDKGRYGNLDKGYISPIPITEEWLLRFGFKYDGFSMDGYDVDLYKLDDFTLSFASFGDKNLMYKGIEISFCESVHQLQNLYFALTGEELTVKVEA